MRMKIKGLSFVRTCEASPEQYDVYKDGKQVGYVRLRWGGLTMSIAEYLEDGADYYEIYGDDCDGDYDNCSCVDCDEHPTRKKRGE